MKYTDRTRAFALAIPLVLLLTVTGCKTISIPPYADAPASHAQTRDSQGLVLTSDPFTEKDRAETYFKIDPAAKGIAIIHLRAENHSPDATWLLTEENMLLTYAAGGGSTNGPVQGATSDYTSSVAAGGVAAFFALGPNPLVLPAVAVSKKLRSDAAVIEKNFIDKGWRNQTLSPGQSAEGFIYFSLGKTNSIQGTSLRLDCLNTRNQQTNSIFLPVGYEAK
jgi:hypothetical protein